MNCCIIHILGFLYAKIFSASKRKDNISLSKEIFEKVIESFKISSIELKNAFNYMIINNKPDSEGAEIIRKYFHNIGENQLNCKFDFFVEQK